MFFKGQVYNAMCRSVGNKLTTKEIGHSDLIHVLFKFFQQLYKCCPDLGLQDLPENLVLGFNPYVSLSGAFMHCHCDSS